MNRVNALRSDEFGEMWQEEVYNADEVDKELKKAYREGYREGTVASNDLIGELVVLLELYVIRDDEDNLVYPWTNGAKSAIKKVRG